MPNTTDLIGPLDPTADEHFIDYIFAFTSPIELGKALQARGYTPNTEFNILLNIILDQELPSKTRMGAMKLLQDLRTHSLEQSGALIQMKATGTRGNVKLEAIRTQRAIAGVQQSFLQETPDGHTEIPGSHQPPTVSRDAAAPVQVTVGPLVSPADPDRDTSVQELAGGCPGDSQIQVAHSGVDSPTDREPPAGDTSPETSAGRGT
jgi:hypothetical protein